jgi:hypothetical protein
MPPPLNVSVCRRFAYAVITPAPDCPGFLLRRALEEHGGNPYVGLAASDYGALMVLFSSPETREEAMVLFPIDFNGHHIELERPEDGANRFGWRFSFFAQLSATGFPLEHWDEGGIRTAFRSIGSVCCIDPLCLNELDYSAVRLVIKLENADDIPHVLLMHAADGDSSAEVRLRVVRVWPAAEHSPAQAHFDDLGGGGSSPGAGGRRAARLSDIDDFSPPRATRASSVMDLWRRVVARRQAASAPVAAMDDIDGVPAGSPLPSFSVPYSPTYLWDRMLARRLAAQFPEVGLDADQVESLAHPLISQFSVPATYTPPLLQWYDTLGTPATPLVPDEAPPSAALVASPAMVAASPLAFAATAEEHEDAVRKQRVRRKRAVDSAFKARRSSRLASKEPKNFVNMLSKAKAVKASRFNLTGGSPRLRAAALGAGFGEDNVAPIPLPSHRALAAACGVDPDAVMDAAPVPAGSP